MQRREFCKAVAAGTVGVVGAGALTTTAAAHPGSLPVVTTRGHFEVVWTWGFWDGFFEDRLTDGHSAYDYDTSGPIPWDADELAVVVHGWANSPWGAASMFSTTASELRAAGFDGEVIGFSYDADVDLSDNVLNASKWWAYKDIAERNGKKLAAFVEDFQQRGGGTVRLIGHSLGGQPVVNALRTLESVGRSVETASLLGPAIEEDEVATDGDYGGAIESACTECHNYYKTDDQVLDKAFSLAQLDAAAGEEGCDGTRPDNYADHDVTATVPDHYSYYGPAGCVSRLVDDWGTIDDGGDDGEDDWWDWWDW